jgi:hypothetical protein
MPAGVFVYVAILHLSIFLLSFRFSVSLHFFISVCLSASLSFCLNVSVSVYTHPSVSQSVRLSICLSREYKRGKYHCTVELLFDWFVISCMTPEIFLFICKIH